MDVSQVDEKKDPMLIRLVCVRKFLELLDSRWIHIYIYYIMPLLVKVHSVVDKSQHLLPPES